jgi:SAM-dependent methyltransferase
MANDSRTIDQLRRHYEVERELAERLRHSTRAQRTELFKTLYGELFDRVPDHPRKTRRESPEDTRRAVAARMALLKPFIKDAGTFLEMAPGDCTLAFEMCRHVKQVLAVDISDQTASQSGRPANFKLVVYDGYHLDVPEASVDLAFSYQFLEHLHPDDVAEHFKLIHRVLRPGGAYVFSTPHCFSGPHDISRHFSDTPSGFHLKEWTYGEMRQVLRAAEFSASYTYRFGKPRLCPVWNAATLAVEKFIGVFPRKLQRRFSARIFEGVTMVARK